MKKWILLTAICSLPLQLMAQDDDMYFVPTKENVAKEAENYGMPRKTYYSGSNRSIDDYNGRLSSTVTPIDSMGQEVENDDYKYTRQLSRFDDYTPSQAYWEGYRDGRWNSPWYYGRYGWYSTWYDPWYASWYDPWYDSWYYTGYYGWSSPWRYGWYSSYYYRPWGYYGWYRPYYHYYGGRSYRSSAHQRFHANRNVRGTSAFGNGFGRNRSAGSFSNRSNNGSFGNRSTTSRTTTNNGGFNGSRNSTGFGSSNRSSSSSGGSFGSSRSSSSSGGSRGGSFGGGGGRSGGGGGRFGR